MNSEIETSLYFEDEMLKAKTFRKSEEEITITSGIACTKKVLESDKDLAEKKIGEIVFDQLQIALNKEVKQ